MATRFYPCATTPADVDPAFGAWTENSEALRRKMVTTKIATEALASTGVVSFSTTAGTTQLVRQFVSGELASQTIATTCTVKCQVVGRENATSNNITGRMAVFAFSSSGGTLRGTLIALSNPGTSGEFTAAFTDRELARGLAIGGTPVVLQAHDRLVVEIGAGSIAAGVMAAPGVEYKFGAPTTGSDLATGAGATVGIPWIEFSQTLNFAATIYSQPAAVISTGVVALKKQSRLIRRVTEVSIAQLKKQVRISRKIIESSLVALAASKIYKKVLSIVETSLVSLSRKATYKRTIAVVETSVVSLARRISQSYRIVETSVVALSKRIQKQLSVTGTGIVGFGKQLIKTIVVAIVSVGVVGFSKQKIITLVATVIKFVSYRKLWVISGVAHFLAKVKKRIFRSIPKQ